MYATVWDSVLNDVIVHVNHFPSITLRIKRIHILLYRAIDVKSTHNNKIAICFQIVHSYTCTVRHDQCTPHSLKSDTVFIHIFNTIYWIPSHRKSSLKWVHWVHFYLDSYFSWSCFYTPFISFICVIRVVRSPNYDAHILIRTIWIRYMDYLLTFVYFIGLGDKQIWILLKLRYSLRWLTTTVLKRVGFYVYN